MNYNKFDYLDDPLRLVAARVFFTGAVLWAAWHFGLHMIHGWSPHVAHYIWITDEGVLGFFAASITVAVGFDTFLPRQIALSSVGRAAAAGGKNQGLIF